MRRTFCFCLLLLLPIFVLFCPAAGSAAGNADFQLTQARWALHTDAVSGQKSLRIVLDATGPVNADGALTNTPAPCLVINVSGAAASEQLSFPIKLDGKIANRMTVSSDGQNSKMIVELPCMIGEGDYRVFTLPGNPAANKPFRVVVDINKAVQVPALNFTAGLKDKIIAIDPGHGGSDAGASGPDNIREKDVTLAVALKVKALLEQVGAKVCMTRMDDRDVYAPYDSADDELGARVAIGNQNKADVFVDIHANYFGNPQVSGTGTYYYPGSLYGKLLAQNIQNSVVNAAGLNNRGIFPANFYVLKYTVMPSILVEMGFLSNQDEEKRLNTPQLQQKLAQGIVDGLAGFFNQAAKAGGGS